jgi:hypothetical protein
MGQLANSIKNSILVALMILILHVALKYNLELSAVPARARRAADVVSANVGVDGAEAFRLYGAGVAETGGDDKDLLEYVFGAQTDVKHQEQGQQEQEQDQQQVRQKEQPAQKPQKEQGGSSKPAKTGQEPFHKGFSLVGTYDNETTMCGGALFGGSLQGFDLMDMGAPYESL